MLKMYLFIFFYVIYTFFAIDNVENVEVHSIRFLAS